MAKTAIQPMIDPLGAFIAGAFIAGSHRPVPLVSTAFEVEIRPGLAWVTTRRVFCNQEAASIEATITFPLPVHAVLFHLEARIDGRVLTGKANAKAQARETYEGAVSLGKSAVLHEELLRGVHMLSVAHIGPGQEIEVITRWATTLSLVGGLARLRIPQTVGDIYGRSGLSDSDELITGGAVQTCSLKVHCPDAAVRLINGHLIDGETTVPNNRPIDLGIAQTGVATLHGRAANGRAIQIRIEPLSVDPVPLRVAVLVDHSGSMDSGCSGAARSSRTTNHAAVVEGLKAIAAQVLPNDYLEVWEFDTSCKLVGQTQPLRARQDLPALARRLQAPSGGTDINDALATVLASTKADAIVMITDGQSFALDVDALAKSERPISVVLVGADSLEARVGHLAAVTGGDILVSTELDLAQTLVAALNNTRRPALAASRDPNHIQLIRMGALIQMDWSATIAPPAPSDEARAVGALAASLRLPRIPTSEAADYAASEGIVCHLTSLVLVDEAGAVQEGLPGQRKVSLPEPESHSVSGNYFRAISYDAGQSDSASLSADMQIPSFLRRLSGPEDAPQSARSMRSVARSERRTGEAGLKGLFGINADRERALQSSIISSASKMPELTGLEVAQRIDWDLNPSALALGDFSDLDTQLQAQIISIAQNEAVCALAYRLGVLPECVAIALIALCLEAPNRSAARIVNLIINRANPAELVALGEAIKLWPASHQIVLV